MKRIALAVIIMMFPAFIAASEAGTGSNTIKGMASWYSESDPGVMETTANMERFDDTKLTCAMWSVPFNTILKVTNPETGRYIYVRVNDRGPAERLVQEGRIIDLAKEAFSHLADTEKGLISVSVEII